MCKKCEQEDIAHKAQALNQIRDMLAELQPNTEFLFFTANIDEASPHKHMAVCHLAGSLNRPAMAALLAELHMRSASDPEVYDMATQFIKLRQEQQQKLEANEPLDLSMPTIMPTNNRIH